MLLIDFVLMKTVYFYSGEVKFSLEKKNTTGVLCVHRCRLVAEMWQDSSNLPYLLHLNLSD